MKDILEVIKSNTEILRKAMSRIQFTAEELLKKPKLQIVRNCDDFGKHQNDFEKRCCFRDQIEHIGVGTEYGSGEEVKVKMQSGKTAIYRLFSERYDYTFDDTGQKNWKYLFIKYEL